MSLFTPQDHQTWEALCTRQLTLIEDVACQQFLRGWSRLGLSTRQLPELPSVSDKLTTLVNWRLVNAENKYLNRDEWFAHIRGSCFPVTNYIRQPAELDFTPLPDLFHEYFGHLPFFTDPYFASIAQKFGEAFARATSEQQRIEIQRIWWFSIEFGLIREGSTVKVLGAGLLSSPGELKHALSSKVSHLPFDLAQVTKTPLQVNAFHKRYFVLEDLNQLAEQLEAFS